MTDIFVAPFEVKSTGSADNGEFEGYGAVFGNVDWHGDVIVPGAFTAGLAERKAAGRRVAMHLNHGLPQLLGRRGVGVWTHIAEDSRGLEVKGKISGMNTETGRVLYEGIKDGALPGLSIGYAVRPNGAEFGTKAAAIAKGARRLLRDVGLEEISIVDTPSNAQSLVLQVKAQSVIVDSDRARAGIAALMALHQRSMTGHAAPTTADRAEFLSHLQDLQDAMGGPLPDAGTKAVPTTIREFEATLRDVGFSHAQARDIAAAGFPKTQARDEPGGQASPPEAKSALSELLAEIAAFKL
ncbi:HK97 family phage prohead protease [Methylobacterium sp. Leaf118]|uniref:HK97 family phage prohead protease n=1 Tax=Methylobacterium sp. Leaf118 TaxID=2876562 RepID=UPI001E300480|nr:HK97 family phage prohead protease [Methylobacterium sp. Leaf118]